MPNDAISGQGACSEKVLVVQLGGLKEGRYASPEGLSGWKRSRYSFGEAPS